MNKNIYKLAIAGTLLSIANCTSTNKTNEPTTKILNTYSLQTCDREQQAFFVEMEHRGEHYTGFINTDNSQKIPTAEKQLKIGKQISFESIRRHLDGIYRTYE